MPAPKRFHDYKFIMEDLEISRTSAYNVLHMFEAQGLAIRTDPKGAGKGGSLRVRATVYERWLNGMDGGDPRVTKRTRQQMAEASGE